MNNKVKYMRNNIINNFRTKAATMFCSLALTSMVFTGCDEKAFEAEGLGDGVSVAYEKGEFTLVKHIESKSGSITVEGASSYDLSIFGGSAKFFDIANNGVITINDANKDALIGDSYSIKVGVKYSETDSTEVNLKLKIESLPWNLNYPTNLISVVKSKEANSVVPVIEGSGALSFSLVGAPSGIFINPKDGQITISENVEAESGVYELTVEVSNIHGTTKFEKVYKVNLLGAPLKLEYAGGPFTVVTGEAFSSGVATLNGDVTKYTLVDSSNLFAIDAITGEITLAAGNTAATGNYPLTVVVTNEYGDTTFEDVLVVEVQGIPRVLVFEDGWQNGTSIMGEHRLYNFTQFDPEGDGKQALNKKWGSAYGFWSVNGDNCAQIVTKKIASKDWIISKNKVDLTSYHNSLVALNIATEGSTDYELSLVYSEDYSGTGDPTTATWTEAKKWSLNGDNSIYGTGKVGANHNVEMAGADGKQVYVALRLNKTDITTSYKTIYIYSFNVKANTK